MYELRLTCLTKMKFALSTVTAQSYFSWLNLSFSDTPCSMLSSMYRTQAVILKERYNFTVARWGCLGLQISKKKVTFSPHSVQGQEVGHQLAERVQERRQGRELRRSQAHQPPIPDRLFCQIPETRKHATSDNLPVPCSFLGIPPLPVAVSLV